MEIVLAGNQQLKETIGQKDGAHQYIWVSDAGEFINSPDADAYIDFAFHGHFFSPFDKPLLIAETVETFEGMPNHPVKLARFCHWAGFAERHLWELAATENHVWLFTVMEALGKKFELVQDRPGLVAPRIISMIINEAYHALDEGVSTKHEIDIAMKLGTNYPYGPFAWADIIGHQNIYKLLQALSAENARYTPHQMLQSFNQ